MEKIDLHRDKLAMWVVCSAIGEDFHLIDQMVVDENHLRDVVFSVGGVELDFNRVIKRIDEIYDEAVDKAAKRMVYEKYHQLVDDLDEIRKRARGIIPFCDPDDDNEYSD